MPIENKSTFQQLKHTILEMRCHDDISSKFTKIGLFIINRY